MATETFIYYVCDLFSGEVLEELPFSKFSYTRTKNRPGGWSAEIPYRHPKVSASLLDPWTKSVYVGRGDAILAGGILQYRTTTEGEPMKVGGEGFFSYYRDGRRHLRSRVGMTSATGANGYEITFTQVEQFDIVQNMLNHAAAYGTSVEYDDINYFGPGVGGISGVKRDRTYFTYEYKQLGEAVEQLSEVIAGFDFSESYYWSGGLINRAFNLWYPYKGATPPIIFEVGANVLLLERDEDGAEFATRAIALGSGEADAQLKAEAIDTTKEFPTGRYPVLESIETYSDVSIQATLNSHASHDLIQKKVLRDTIETQITDKLETQLGAFDWGDRIQAVADDGALQLDDLYRIESYSVDIDQNGAVSVKPSLALFAQSIGT